METGDIIRLSSKWGELMRKGDLVPEWKNFNTFLKWADKNGYKKGMALRKPDKSKPYGPYNWELCCTEHTEDSAKEEIGVSRREAAAWDRTVEWFREQLAKARALDVEKLLARIRNGKMPPDWYKKK